MHPLYDPAVQPGISTKEMKAHSHKEICILFIEALLIIDKNWKQPKDPSKRMVILYVYIM